MVVAWLLAGLFLLAFASCIIIAMALRATSLGAGIVFIGLMGIALTAFALWLLFHALCRISIHKNGDVLTRSKHLGPIRRVTRYPQVRTVFLIVIRAYGRYRSVDRTNIIVSMPGRKRVLIDDLTCDDPAVVFNWLADATDARCLDMRHRGAVNA